MGHPPIKPPSSRRDNPDSTTTPSPHPRTRPNHPLQRLTAKLGLARCVTNGPWRRRPRRPKGASPAVGRPRRNPAAKSRDFNFLDSQNWEGLAETVLAEDIYFEMFGKGRTGVTRVSSFISKSLEGASTVHHGHNEEIVLTGPDTATGVWRLEDHTKMPPGSQIPDFDDCGQYRDEYIRTEQGWRIHRSVLTFP